MRLFGQKGYSIEARRSRATHTTEGGTYHLAEVAFISHVGDEDFVTSVCVGGRQDPMSAAAFEERRQQAEGKTKKAKKAAKAKAKAAAKAKEAANVAADAEADANLAAIQEVNVEPQITAPSDLVES